MRVQVEEVPRIESTSTSSTAKSAATWAYLLFHLSRPASASSLMGEFATTIKGIFVRGAFFAADLARDGATRGASPSILRKCGGQGASPNPADSSLAAISSNGSSDPAVESMPACGSPISAKRLGMLSTVKSAGSQSGTSCQ